MIELRNLWKIFAARPEQVLAAAREGSATKDELRQRFDAVIGVADATFRIERGEIFCVMGLSGSGKSTLVRLINRLIEPTDGDVLIDGVNVGRLSATDLRQLRARTIGMVFQANALLPHRSVRDNVAMPLEIQHVARYAREDRAEEALAKVGLAGWGDRSVQDLSGGMQQRVGLARAIAADPGILLMDEPFSALDPLIRRQLQDEFLRLSRDIGKTTVFITHDLQEAIRIGDRIAIMRDGVVIQIGTPPEILHEPANDYVRDFVAHIAEPLAPTPVADGIREVADGSAAP
ncbi:betaine/proline/choline family ABC transporter ATP-binding protein [Labrys sp. KNU-23]|uniref:quaternary amine ABC transporter ATP-binding protein n=1 Tax=Labrys sp. KNU-23 TaxID=2789216 RepID=UPI0011EFF5BD|nr:betaine/proline/choline family ABC transporter ATP-binding protein [Labrys sp. KNU-23]QEN85832.1 betaine/proline/choline family ABC transporter ATP-binding protein [Labrys sp. KNU-23]